MKERNVTEFISKMTEYSETCIDVCTHDSQEAIVLVGKIIEVLISDASRISKMSHDALAALSDVKEYVENKSKGSSDDEFKVSNLIGILEKLSHEDVDVNMLLIPLVETLQFQDRISQQLNNIKTKMRVWKEYRANVPANKEKYEEFMLEFGKELLNTSTTPQEKDSICKHIPNVPRGEEIDSNNLFF